jgi:hypothetical protein
MNAIVKHEPTENPHLTAARSDVSVVRAMAPEIIKRYMIPLQGKMYVQVTGATLLANGLGYTVREREVRRIDIPGCGWAWEAVAEVIDRETGMVIGVGSGIVTDDEKPWGSRPMFARRAMASTRAAGRALRLCLGHLFAYLGDKVASTTAEEMPEET